MPLSKGDRLGPYEILTGIGSGGMGEVYKATDTRLDRIVALKVSKAAFSERFEREARAISSLNHPHICQLYDVGPNYLVMEYIEGVPLKGPLRLEKVLEYAGQIASALDAAHSKKITHRDLKPANILVTKSAGVKLLDFGLAKIGKPVSLSADDETVTMALTGKGTILGTLLYMSPEQIQGNEADARSDIFSFGLVLYEMLTGKRAFEGVTPASVMGAILERPAPSVTDIAPAALHRVFKRCLEKDPENRWQSARDLLAGLELVSPEPVAVNVAAQPQPPQRSPLPWIAAAVATFAALSVAAIHFREQPPAAPEPMRFQLLPQEGQTYRGSFALSPDGHSFAYIASGADGVPHLWVRTFNAIEAKPVAEVSAASSLAWSPGSRSLAFILEGKLKRVDATTGAVDNVTDLNFSGSHLSWSTGGVIISDNPSVGFLFTVPATGGVLGKAGTGTGGFPTFLPDGQHYLYIGETNTIWVAALDPSEPRKRLRDLPLGSNLSYVPIPGESAGYILFMLDTAIMAQRFDLLKLELSGEPITVVNGVARGAASAGYFSVSDEGVLAYRPGSRARNSTWFNQEGKTLGSFPGASSIALSPDASKAAIQTAVPNPNSDDIWIVDLLRNTNSRFTFDPGREANAVWSPDGTQVAYSADHGKTRDIYTKPSNGSGNATLLFESNQPKSPHQWTRDYLVFSSTDAKTKLDIWILKLTGDRQASPFLQTPFNESQGQVSPDGRWLAYASDESGVGEIYVRSFPDGNGKWQISSAGGSQPRWSRDGHKLFFRAASGLLDVDVTPGPIFQYGVPKTLFDPQGAGATQSANPYYDVAPDGRLLVTTFAPETTSGPVTLVLNWQAALKK